MRKEVADEISAAARNDPSPIFGVGVERLDPPRRVGRAGVVASFVLFCVGVGDLTVLMPEMGRFYGL